MIGPKIMLIRITKNRERMSDQTNRTFKKAN